MGEISLKEKLKNKLKITSALDSFNGLASEDDKIRFDACTKVFQYAFSKLNTEKNDVEFGYVLERLVRWAASSKPALKKSAYVTLCMIFNNIDGVETNQIIELAKKYLIPEAGVSKSEVTHCSLGLILVYGALCKSRLFANISTEEKAEVVNALIVASNQKTHNKIVGNSFIIDALKTIDFGAFRSHIWPCISNELPETIDDLDVDSVHLLLSCKAKYPKLKSKLNLQDETNVKGIAKLLYENSYLSPEGHPVYKSIAHLYLSLDSTVQKTFAKSLVKNIKTQESSLKRSLLIVLSIFCNIFSEAKSSSTPLNVSLLIRSEFLTALAEYLKVLNFGKHYQDVVFVKFNGFSDILLEFVKKSSTSSESALKLLRKLLAVEIAFDEVTHGKLTKGLTTLLNDSGVETLVEIYKEALKGEDVSVTSKETVLKTITRLVSHPAVANSLEWRIEHVKLFMSAALWGSDELVPGNSTSLEATIKECFYKLLDQKYSKLEDLNQALATLVQTLHPHVCNSTVVPLTKPLDENALECWTTIQSLLHDLADAKSPEKKLLVLVFELLLLNMALLLFKDQPLAISTVGELHNCYTRVFTRKKNRTTSGEPFWSEVLLDLFLNLLSQESHLYRNVVSQAFSCLCSELTMSGLHQILFVLSPDNDAELKEDNASEESDDEEDVGDSSGDEEEGNDASEEGDEDDDFSDDTTDENVNDKLRMAIREALGGDGYKTDEESVDLDEMDVQQGRKLDAALAQAFRTFKPNHGATANKRKQSKRDNNLMHFRIRVLDLVEMYAASEAPDAAYLTEMIVPLLQCLEYTVKDPHQKPLEQRLKGVFKKLLAVRSFKNTEELLAEDLVKLLKWMLLEKGETSTSVYHEIGPQLTECCVFVLRLAKNCNTGAPEAQRLLVEVVERALTTFFVKNNAAVPLALFKQVFALNWPGVVDLVPVVFEVAVRDNLRPFRRAQALELLQVFYKNTRLDLEDAEISRRIGEVERDFASRLLSVIVAESLSSYVVQLLEMLVAARKNSCVLKRQTYNWDEIAAAVKECRTRCKLSTDAKKAYVSFCTVFNVAKDVPDQTQAKVAKKIKKIKSKSNKEQVLSSMNGEKKVAKKIKRKPKGDVLKQKKEAKKLRLERESEGLSVDFSRIQLYPNEF